LSLPTKHLLTTQRCHKGVLGVLPKAPVPVVELRTSTDLALQVVKEQAQAQVQQVKEELLVQQQDQVLVAAVQT